MLGCYIITVATNSRKYFEFAMEYCKYEFSRVLIGIDETQGYFTLMIDTTLDGL